MSRLLTWLAAKRPTMKATAQAAITPLRCRRVARASQLRSERLGPASCRTVGVGGWVSVRTSGQGLGWSR